MDKEIKSELASANGKKSWRARKKRHGKKLRKMMSKAARVRWDKHVDNSVL